VASKSPDTLQGIAPDTGRVKTPRKPTIAAVRAFIAEQGRATVYVTEDYAPAFRKPPRDGNVYIVEDPKRRGVLHWTDRDGHYLCLEEKSALLVPVSSTKGPRNKKPKKPVRRVEQLTSSALLQSVPDADPVPIRLIKLERVMQITGFGKSFLYEQADFPRPVKLGIAKRAAVRWSEAEVTAWVNNLLAGRGDQVEE
jgi:predicted DNA-binding transcriptional regulator AlpA